MTLARLPTFPREAYGPMPERIRLVKRVYPSERGWGPGWPNCPDADVLADAKSIRPRDGRSFNRPVRHELAPLFSFLMQATMDLGYEFRRNDEPDGEVSTYACRAIKGSHPPAPSWHSWGLAIDINANGNPQFTFRSTQPPWMVELWERSGFYWGGRYRPGSEDAMHFEYCFRPADVATDMANARAAHQEIKARLHPADPNTPEVPVTPDQVKLLQLTLNKMGASPPLAVDGVFGAKTETALNAAAASHLAQKARLAAKDTTFDTIVLNAETGRSA